MSEKAKDPSPPQSKDSPSSKEIKAQPSSTESSQTLYQDLSPIGFPRLLFRLLEEKATGLLYVTDQNHRISLVFYQGAPVFASSNNYADSLGQLLVDRSVISKFKLNECINEAQKENKRLGMVLVQRGLLTAKQLKDFIKEQIRNIIFKLFSWENGFFYFESQNLGDRQTINFDETPLGLILRGIRERYDLNRLLKEGFKLQIVLQQRRPASDPLYQNMNWEEDLETLFQMVDGQKNLQALVEKSPFDSQMTLNGLFALLVTQRLTFDQEPAAFKLNINVKDSPPSFVFSLANKPSGKTAEIWRDFSLSGAFHSGQPKTAASNILWESAPMLRASLNPKKTRRQANRKVAKVVSTPTVPAENGPVILGDIDALTAAYELKKKNKPSADLSAQTSGEIVHENEITLDPDELQDLQSAFHKPQKKTVEDTLDPGEASLDTFFIPMHEDASLSDLNEAAENQSAEKEKISQSTMEDLQEEITEPHAYVEPMEGDSSNHSPGSPEEETNQNQPQKKNLFSGLFKPKKKHN